MDSFTAKWEASQSKLEQQLAAVRSDCVQANDRLVQLSLDVQHIMIQFGSENTAHALKQCQMLTEIWYQQFPQVMNAGPHEDFREMVVRVQGNHCQEELERLFMIAWACWYRRNQWVFEEKQLESAEVINHALCLLMAYKATKHTNHNGIQRVTKWQLSPQGTTKLNVDGAIFHADGSAGVGLILRDWEGKVILAVSKKEAAVMEPLEIELIAILRGLQFCIPLGLQALTIETDSLILAQELSKPKLANAMFRNIVTDIKQLQTRIPICSIVHVNREANE
ncbi:uncharacterized protein LOC122293837 [Carya illinoinensis]|uniref:uncharacterized protein LOC122293837 n=1 Tax=Carya illinoinensis TaxID=32201 RepID=UPI001C71DA32|nr:uncharacterized protein LOC122293837 [Carya illinoinensis]